MSRTATADGADRLLHCSPDRTLLLTTDPTTGERLVAKVFVRGSMADAEREVATGQLVAHLGTLVGHRAGLDPASNRPCVFSRHVAGADLDTRVAAAGALPAAMVVELLQPVAATLAAMHTLAVPAAPHGLVHGDVKPKNLLATTAGALLLDFEHAAAVAAAGPGANAGGPRAGTSGFQAPEVELGAAPTPAADVFALGRTFAWLLDGGGARRLPQHPEVDRLVASCTAAAPGERPTMAAVAARLAELRALLAGDPGELALAAACTADVAAARKALAGVADAARRRPLERWLVRAERALRFAPDLLQVPAAEPAEPSALRRELSGVARVLGYFPRHAGALRWRQRLAAATGVLLSRAAAHASALRRAEEFAAAELWLEEALLLLREALGVPGGCPIPAPDEPRSVGLLHRDPLQFLHQQLLDVAAAREDLAAEAAAITAAEQRLDLTAAEAEIDRMAAHYGGASPTAARRRDQLHRLAFYLQRVARAKPNVERLGQLWDAAVLLPLRRLVDTCAAGALPGGRTEGPAGPVGLRSLQVTLVNLAEEFPHLDAHTGPALTCLGRALEHTTDQAGALLAEAQQALQAVPVPVRPLQIALGRLDAFRMLEAFVDRPERPRSQLQDGIEQLRLALEQARATRDRLAHGAEQALARGHWTTGLFDMERAVAGLPAGDDPEGEEARRLRDRLAEARRRKQEVDAAVRRNVELAGRYGVLQDDATSSFAARLQLLADRRDCLHFLTMHLPADRSALYGRDLREVETLIALEQAGQAETELDGAHDPFERLQIARSTVDRLGASFTATDLGNELPGRMQRLLEHWRTVAVQCQREVDRLLGERQARQRLRRRLVAVAALTVLATLTAVLLALRGGTA